MQPNDLTTLAEVKSWLNISTSGDDVILSRLISSTSQYIQSWLNRQFTVASGTEVYNGVGTQQLALRNYPVVSVSAVVVDGISIPQSSDGVRSGFVYDSKMVYLIGYQFTRASQNIKVTYTWGYQQNNELAAIPAVPYQISAASLSLPWNKDVSVAFASDGAVLTSVSGIPTTGQYAVSYINNAPVYTFAAADTGKAVLITYAYTPYEIEQACIELLSIRYRERTRIGENSKNIGGETVSFNVKDMPDSVKTILNNYRRVVPSY